jgi:hypothetical protein
LEKKRIALKAKLSKQSSSAAKLVTEQCATDIPLNSSDTENQDDGKINVQAFTMKSLLISNIGSHPNERHRQLEPRGKGTISNKREVLVTSALPKNKADVLRLGLELAKRRLKLAELQKMKRLHSTSVAMCSNDPKKVTETESDLQKSQSDDLGGELSLSSRAEMKEVDGSLLLGMIHKQQILLRQHKENLHIHTSSLQECQSLLEEEKKLRHETEKRLLDLMQRKDGTEKMVTSITKKIMRLRRRRNKDSSSECTRTSS